MDQGDINSNNNNNNNNSLHQNLHASNSIKKKKKVINVPKLLSEERLIVRELNLWEAKVHQLKQAKSYMQKGEELELKENIQHWRLACQNIAMVLVPIVLQEQQGQQPSTLLSWGYDDGYERELSSLEEQEYTHDDADIDSYHELQKRQRHQYKKNEQEKENDNDNDMAVLLSQLRIDPQLIHYSTEKDEFYD